MNLEDAKESMMKMGDDIIDDNFRKYLEREEEKERIQQKKIIKMFSSESDRRKHISSNMSEDDMYLLYYWADQNIKDENDCYINNDILKMGGNENDGFFIIDNKWRLSFYNNLLFQLSVTEL